MISCHRARELYIGSIGAPDGALAEARAHVASCAACCDRLDLLAAAAVVGGADELSCAECLARVSRSGSAEPLDLRHIDTLAAAHLADCALCAAVVADIAPTLAALSAGSLPEPAHYPAADLSFLPAPGQLAPGSEGEDQRLMPPQYRRPWLAWLGTWALAALVLVVGWWLYAPRDGGKREAALATATTASGVVAPVSDPTRGAVATTATAVAPGQAAATPTNRVLPTLPAATDIVPPVATASQPNSANGGTITLGAPVPGDGPSGLLRLAWAAPALSAGSVFDVRVCRGTDCEPTVGKTNVTDRAWVWCPDEGAGAYRWQVVVIDVATKRAVGPTSAVEQFTWSGGECAESASPEPIATATPEPTSSEPPPEP